MALKLHSGDFKTRVTIKQPTAVRNNEGGTDVTHTVAFPTWAAERKIDQKRVAEAGVTEMIDTRFFYIRYAESRKMIDAGWLIEIAGVDYTIHAKPLVVESGLRCFEIIARVNMAKGNLIDIPGLKELQKKLGRIPQRVISEVDGKMHMAANDFANRAVKAAPVDQGMLRQGISAKKNGVMDYEVVSAADYSAYIEWGTKTKVQVPPDLASYAAQFKGKGGSGKGLFEKIFEWVKRKGIAATLTKSGGRSRSKKALEAEYQAARAIFFSIITKGIKAQPFFFQHRKEVYAQLQKDLGPAIKKALRK